MERSYKRFQLEDDDLATVEAWREHAGLGSTAAALRDILHRAEREGLLDMPVLPGERPMIQVSGELRAAGHTEAALAVQAVWGLVVKSVHQARPDVARALVDACTAILEEEVDNIELSSRGSQPTEGEIQGSVNGAKKEDSG